MGLNERHRHILNELTKAYLNTGQPVGSNLLATTSDIGLSPASIRNVMCELEHMGYLYSPHTSAGRAPTDKGLRYFVDALMVVDEDMRQRVECVVEKHLWQAADCAELFLNASRELAQLTQFAGLVSVRGGHIGRIHRIEFVPVSSEQILAVLITDVGDVKNRLVPRQAQLSDGKLAEISHRLSALLADCDLRQARLRLVHEMQVDRLRIKDIIRDLVSWTELKQEGEAELFISGQRQLLEVPELSVIDTLRSLLSAFEEKETLLQLIHQVELASSGVTVLIGSEHALVNMEEVSVVLARFHGRAAGGTLGVIGPKRMHYERVFPIVASTARGLSRRLGGWS